MGEKEERIYIGKINWQEPAGFCPVPMGECNRFCEDCQGGMTRQEAIERMAKAICKETNYQCSVCDFGDNKEKCEAWIYFQYKASAEAALNALLEVDK